MDASNESAAASEDPLARPTSPAGASGAAMANGAKSTERRFRPRRPYPYMQRMAPIVGGQMPGLHEFREVECNDIGAGGFSYFTPTRPVENDIIVAFGSGASQTYLLARLVHITPKVNHGQPMFLVGCRYTGRHTYTR